MYITLQTLSWFVSLSKIPYDIEELSTKVPKKPRILVLNELGVRVFQSGFIVICVLDNLISTDNRKGFSKIEMINEKFHFLIQKNRGLTNLDNNETMQENWTEIFDVLNNIQKPFKITQASLLEEDLQSGVINKRDAKCLTLFINYFFLNFRKRPKRDTGKKVSPPKSKPEKVEHRARENHPPKRITTVSTEPQRSKSPEIKRWETETRENEDESSLESSDDATIDTNPEVDDRNIKFQNSPFKRKKKSRDVEDVRMSVKESGLLRSISNEFAGSKLPLNRNPTESEFQSYSQRIESLQNTIIKTSVSGSQARFKVSGAKTIDSFLIYGVANNFNLKKKDALTLVTKRRADLNELIRHPRNRKEIVSLFTTFLKFKKKIVSLLCKEERKGQTKNENNPRASQQQKPTSVLEEGNMKIEKFLRIVAFGFESDNNDIVMIAIEIFSHILMSTRFHYFEHAYWSWFVSDVKSLLDVLVFSIERNSYKTDLRRDLITMFTKITQNQMNLTFVELEKRYKQDMINFVKFIDEYLTQCEITKKEIGFLSIVVQYYVDFIIVKCNPEKNQEKELFVTCVSTLLTYFNKFPFIVQVFSENSMIVDKLGHKLKQLLSYNMSHDIVILILNMFFKLLSFKEISNEIALVYYNTIIECLSYNEKLNRYILEKCHYLLKMTVENFPVKQVLSKLFSIIMRIGYTKVDLLFLTALSMYKYLIVDEALLILMHLTEISVKSQLFFEESVKALGVLIERFCNEKKMLKFVDKFSSSILTVLFIKLQNVDEDKDVVSQNNVITRGKKGFKKSLIVKTLKSIILLKNRLFNKCIQENLERIYQLDQSQRIRFDENFQLLASVLEQSKQNAFDGLDGMSWMDEIVTPRTQAGTQVLDSVGDLLDDAEEKKPLVKYRKGKRKRKKKKNADASTLRERFQHKKRKKIYRMEKSKNFRKVQIKKRSISFSAVKSRGTTLPVLNTPKRTKTTVSHHGSDVIGDVILPNLRSKIKNETFDRKSSRRLLKRRKAELEKIKKKRETLNSARDERKKKENKFMNMRSEKKKRRKQTQHRAGKVNIPKIPLKKHQEKKKEKEKEQHKQKKRKRRPPKRKKVPVVAKISMPKRDDNSKKNEEKNEESEEKNINKVPKKPIKKKKVIRKNPPKKIDSEKHEEREKEEEYDEVDEVQQILNEFVELDKEMQN